MENEQNTSDEKRNIVTKHFTENINTKDTGIDTKDIRKIRVLPLTPDTSPPISPKPESKPNDLEKEKSG